jgi:two-component system response regulator FixJ
MSTEPTVFVVDDDAAVRESLRWLIESAGLKVTTYPSAEEFLPNFDPNRPGCLVLDVRLPGTTGLVLQERLRENHVGIPVIIITGHADVAMAIKAMKNGAVDLIEKPFGDEALLESIRLALQRDQETRTRQARKLEAILRLRQLTLREHQVFELLVAGWSHRRIAAELKITDKTVQVHRSKIRHKTQTATLADLVRLAITAKS